MKQLRLLVAEDNPDARYIMTVRLQQMGYVVEMAENGRLALELLQHKSNDFDLILMDTSMPVMDGLEAIRHIRASPATQRLPILVVSASEIADSGASMLTIRSETGGRGVVKTTGLALNSTMIG